ncbi:MAG: hypothetical protein DWQ29_11735 [Planctomycetota bacterium]|nr:MAG: hypothetical protein DWQ29_11735 [Planctomycetota bacterium]
MHEPQVAQLEMLARLDQATSRAAEWADRRTAWQPLSQAQTMVKRALGRAETLRVRLEAPIVVATFGGTGTGKSSLINAIVGEECTQSGRERPTTRRPIVIAHPKADLEPIGLPLDEVEIVRRDAEILRDLVLIDCPDPDTSETEEAGSNLQRLHALLPYCDVLIYTSTQQKYRSARVAEELGQAAAGCRLVFVQTHADLDEDVREDWRARLREHYEIPDVFLIDSLRGLQEQQASQRPSGDLARLQDLLTTQLAASERMRVRRANVVDLLLGVVGRCRELLQPEAPRLDDLEEALAQQNAALSESLSTTLRGELIGSRHLWERRLLAAVTETWGFSPFSGLLRLYQGLGALIASFALFRSRSAAQMALVGAMQGARWWSGRRAERQAEENLESAFCLDDATLREASLVVDGHRRSAGMLQTEESTRSLTELQGRAAQLERDFLTDAARRIDDVIDRLARRNSRWFVRLFYELMFAAYLMFVLYRVGKNFFYDSWIHDAPLLSTDFYIPALLFFLLWAGLLLMAFTHRLRRGLNAEIDELAREMVHRRFGSGLFPDLEESCRQARGAVMELDAINASLGALRDEIAISTALGGRRAPGATVVSDV